jgi:hypothetical protein
MFWVPQSGDIGVGVSILSYNDAVQFSLISDRHFIPDPETVTPLFAAEFEKMLLALLMLEWDRPLDPMLAEEQLFGMRATAQRRSTANRIRRRRAKVARQRGRHTGAVRGDPPTPALADGHDAKCGSRARIPKRFRK